MDVDDALLEIVEALGAHADWQAALRQSELRSRIRGQIVEDRRAHVRHRPLQLDRPLLARLKPGPLLTVIDVSAGGALIQTPARLNPGAHVLLEFLRPGTTRTIVVRSRVIRSQVASLEGCLRYRGGCSFDEMLELAEFLAPARDASSDGHAAAREALRAVRRILTEADSLARPKIARLLEEMQSMAEACATRTALFMHVEAWLRTQVPLLALRVNPRFDSALRGSNVLSFKLAAGRERARRVNIEVLPACGLDDSQVRLLEAGARVMSILHTTPLS